MKKFAKVALLILLGILLYKFITSESKESFIFLRPTLKDTVEESMTGVQGRYAIYIKNLKNGESYFSKENEIFEAGSLYKLWLMEKVFSRINEGSLNEEDVLSKNIADLNKQFDIASDEAELTSGNIKISIKNALEQMITISHNYAAMLLLDKVGNTNIPTKITAKEVGLFFERLYKKEVINEEYSNRMLEFLSRQKINDRIPKLLPSGTRIAHKTADLGFLEHDGGIIFSPKGDYIFIALSESDMPDAAGKKIAELSKAVFEYFNK